MTTGPKTEVLIFVEDPGAANFVAPLPAALADVGRRAKILSCGAATTYLSDRGGDYHPLPKHKTAAEILAEIDPAVLIVGTSENKQSRAFDFIADARAAGIPSIGVVDGPSCTEFRFRGESSDALKHVPDTVIVADAATKKDLIGLGLDEDRAVVCGHPHFDQVRDSAARIARRGKNTLRTEICPDAPDRKPIIAFLAEQADGLDQSGYRRDESYTLFGRGTSDRRVDIVIEEFLDAIATLRERPFLVLRLHPKNRSEEFKQYLPEFDQVSQGGSPLELIMVSDKVVGLSSVLLAEAVLLGRPTLSIVPRGIEREWLITSASGITPCATNRQEVRYQIADEMSSAAPSADIEKVMPKGATMRVASEIARLCGW